MTQTLRYDFLNNPSLVPGTESPSTTPDLSITRATKATMVDTDGYIREVQSGEERMTGATFNQNLHTYSNTFSNAAWTKLNASVAQDATDFDGNANTAWTVTGDGAGAGVEAVGVRGDAITGYNQDDHTFIYAADIKAVNATWVYIYGALSTNLQTWFNLSTGAVGTEGVSVDDSGITDLGGGWYRCWIAFTAAGTAERFYIIAADDDNVAGWTNTSSQDLIEISRAQIIDVSGKTAPFTLPSHVATTTTAVSSLTGTSTKGLLVEAAATNLCLQSEDFLTTWTANNANTTAGTVSNQTTAPDGSTTADKLLDIDNATSGNVSYSQNGVNQATSTAYAFSVFCKKDQLDWCALEIGGNGAESIRQYYDLTNGVVGTPSADVDSSGIEDYGNGWYRCWLTYTSDATDAFVNPTIYCADADGDTTVDRDGTSSIFVWGAQLEAGAFHTSYIATTTTSVTRNDDQVNTSDVTWYNNAGPGTFYAAATPLAINPDEDQLIFTATATANTRYSLRIESTVAGRGDVLVAGGAQTGAVNRTGAYSAGTETKAAIGLAEDDLIGYFDGVVTINNDDTVDLPTDVNNLYIGREFLGRQTNGHIAEIRYYDERLDNTGLENLSNGLFPIPDVVDFTSAGATTLLEANGFVADTTTTAYSDSIAVGNVIEQTAAAGTYAAAGTTVTLTISLGPNPESNTGGWLNEYNAYKQRKAEQERKRKEILQKVRELDGIDGEIAELMQLDQAREDEDRRIAEFSQLLESEISKAELDRAGLLNARINRAYDRAMKKATFSSIEALEREIEDAIEEEDFLFIVMSIQ